MKKYLAIIITAAAILAVSQAAQGADHCVRAGAAGSDTGVDWINAYTALPDVLVRGDTYYVAEGDYPQLRIDDDVNGNLWIYIKKATPSAHGPGTGWTDSYGDGQAVFPKILIRASSHVTTGGNIEIDGVTGSGTSGHGFCIRNSDDTVSLFHVQYYYFEGNSGNIILRHTEICHTNYILDDGADGVYINAASPDLHDFTFSHLYIHDVSRNGFTFTAGSNYLVEHCVLARNHNTAVTHAQGMQITNCHNVTVRYCWFEDIRGTAHIALIGTNVTASNMYVYRNIFFNNDGLTGMSQS
ncbi:MAG: right-handed parallel beta-helix repeat-containing protein, partial [Candidatus Omnitrophota bacterium]|nr:right-handed parallel beta-helix repeat-containing protein [Candidatus Omnitrophota bacterium]